MTGLYVERLRCEHLTDPRGVDHPRPRLSWQVKTERPGTTQAAYQILAASSARSLADGIGDLWDTGKVSSPDCVLVPYSGLPLSSRRQAFWSVRVWDDRDAVSLYAKAAAWEMGLLDPADWQAQWVCGPTPATKSAATYLRSDLVVTGPVLRARAYVTALGLYELHCNGTRVGDARFTPGWTDYPQRLQYQVLDLTDLLVPGTNALGAVLVDGWYAGYVGFQGTREHYGDAPSFLAQLEIETGDGLFVHVTDGSWRAGSGALLSSDMLLGEHFDARLSTDWCRPGSATSWQPVQITVGTVARRVTSPSPPVRVLAARPAMTVERIGTDTHRIDFGQNLVGWVRLRLDGRRDTIVTVRHAEILQPDGSLYVENLRTATATDSYTLDGDGARTFEPSFTFHGFRYAEVTGYEGALEDVTAIVCGSDLEQVGHFECSDEAINALHSNIVWGARGNFLDIPTDCPQRDERMGWTGDAQVFAPTACYLFDMAGFFSKWLRDVTDGQNDNGSFPDVAPLVVLGPVGSAGWADAGVVVPALLWEVYADEQLLAELYPAMRAWVDYVHRANPGLLWLAERGYDNGDWLSVVTDQSGVTDKALIATAYFAHSARLTARAAHVLGNASEARELLALADAIADAFDAEFVLPDGRLTCPTQTAYALALRFGLVPARLRAAAAQHLADDIEAHHIHLTTGFLGVGQLLPALSDAGRTDLAYRLLLQDGYPSWLYAVKAGATTIWERWDGWTTEAGYGDPAMNSYNHYALGSVGEWLYRTVAGIEYAAPGGRRLRLAPSPDPGLEWASASHLSPYGLVRSGWQWLPDGGLRVEVEVPVGATAAVHLPGGRVEELGSGGHAFIL